MVVGIAFTAILVILAAVLFDSDVYTRSSIPADSDGKVCGIDHVGYPIIYFASPTEIARRVCVSQCPNKGDSKLKCVPTQKLGCRFSSTPGFEMQYYDNQFVKDRNGMFCYPKDESEKEQLIESSQLKHRNTVLNSLDTIILSMQISLGLSVLFMILVQFFPKVMNRVTVVLGIVVMLGLVICTFIYDTPYKKSQLGVGIILAILVLIILLNVCHNPDSWSMHGIFLDYSTKFLWEECGILVYIPIFLGFVTGFIFLLAWQFRSFWSNGNLTFDAQKSLYHEFTGANGAIYSVLLAIQAIWGLSFIKQAFNFCISGNAVLWYYRKQDGCCTSQPFKMLWCKHLGSVIAGSLMTGFFSLADFIFDSLKPDDNAHSQGCYTQCYKYLCCFSIIFDFVRSDAMAYINLTSNPYCNSSRYCEYLCNQSIIMDYSQSTSRAYRICAHFLIAGSMAIMSLYIKGNISVIAMVAVILLCLFISTFMISIHADATEAIQIIFLEDEQFNKRHLEKENNQSNGKNVRKDLEFAINTDNNLQKELAKDIKEERIRQQTEKAKSKQQNNAQPDQQWC